MSNSIWKTPDQKPEEYETMLFESYEWGEPEVGNYQNGLFVPYNDESESLKSDDIEKWCYLDDLIAQADKVERLEKENEAMREEFEVWHGNHKCVLEDNERLQKAVDKAIWILEESKKVQRPDFKLGFTYCLFPQPHLDIILDEIKQLIKGE